MAKVVGKMTIVHCTTSSQIADELRGTGVLAEKDGYKIKSLNSIAVEELTLFVRGKYHDRDYNVNCCIFNTPEQAQHYVKIINELIGEVNNPKTDWSKVAVGSDVQASDGRLGSFHSYVPSLNKVIVICGNEIKAVDASEVELC